MPRLAPTAGGSRRPVPSSLPAPASPPMATRHDLRLAAIDVGSNSLHMAVAQADADGAITTLFRMKEMVGLGRATFPSRRLSAEAIDRAVNTLGRFFHAARAKGCEEVIAIATSAVREAANGGEFLERARSELNLRVRIVPPRDEANLIYLGVRHALPLGNQPHLIVDLGGGSVEFVVGDATRAAMLESRKLGAARMTAKYITADPASPDDLKALSACYDRELSPVCKEITALAPVAAIGTSGSMENLAAMCAALAPKGQSDPNVIERDGLAKLVAKLTASRSADRAKMVGLDEARRDQILAGAMLVNELFRRLDLRQMRICRSALREGILLDYLNRHLPELQIRRHVPDPRRRSVLDLARRCDWHQKHAEHVARLTADLFDQTAALHKLGAGARELIEYGALLHDIGWHIARDGHHKHSQYLIAHGKLRGFSRQEVRIVSLVARYHRRSPPSAKHKPFAKLPEAARRMVQVGAGLLRVADSLDQTHCQVVTGVEAKVVGKGLRVTARTRGDAELELWSAKKKSALLADVLAMPVTVVPQAEAKPADGRARTADRKA